MMKSDFRFSFGIKGFETAGANFPSHLASSVIGVTCILFVAFLLSTNRRAINLRVLGCALLAQFLICVLVLYVPAGRAGVALMAAGVENLMAYANAGIDALFGKLASPQFGMSLAIHMLPVIIFFAALASVLYHLRIMHWVVRILGGALGIVLGVGRVEALCAAANVCVGQSESPLVIRPYLAGLTRAQLFAIMTSGMAGVAGTVLAAYAQMGIRLDYLLAASFMSAPGGLLIAKIMYPDERKDPAPASEPQLEADTHRADNLIVAIADGAQDGVRIAVSVGAMIIAFVALIALANGLLGWLGSLFGLQGLTFQSLLGYVFSPVMYVIGIQWSDAKVAGGLFGERLVTNEFVAYLHLMQNGLSITPRSRGILTFALCGFANLGSVAIQLAVIGGLAPGQRASIAKLGIRALAAASLANLMNAALAGLFIF